MFKSKKFLALSLAALMAVALVGCAGGDAEEATEMQAGDYVMEVEGKEPMEVKVILSANAIEDIEVISQNETEGVADDALSNMPKNIIDEQKVDLEPVSGATYTSGAIKEATAMAIEEAGGDLSDFSDGNIENPEDVVDEVEEE